MLHICYSTIYQKDDLLNAYEVFKKNNYSFVFPATTFPFPIKRAFKKLKSGGIEMFNPDHYKTRSQDLEEAYHDAGQFYMGKPGTWINKEEQFGLNSEIITIPKWRVQDIDSIEDWKSRNNF